MRMTIPPATLRAVHTQYTHVVICTQAGLKRSVAEFKTVSTGRQYVDGYDYDTGP